MSNINERENNRGSIDNTDTDTTTVQPSTQTVRFERISNGTCDLTFTPTDTTDNGEITTTTTVDITSKEATDTTDTTTTQPSSVSISNVSFPYEFDPSEHGFDSVNGTYTFDCCGCPYEFVIEGEDNSVTTTTTTEKDVTTTTTTEKDVTTTTSSSSTTTSTTTTKEGCNNCTTVRVRKANVKTPTTVTFSYTDCDNVSQSETLTQLRTTVDLCVCSGSIPSSADYSVELIEICETGLPVLTCDLLQFTVNDGENGENVSYVNGSGLQILAQTSPQQYVLGQGTYTLTVTVPSGYSNAGDTLNCVTDEVIVTQGGGDTTTTSTKGPSDDPFMFFEANQYECINNGTTCEQVPMLVIVKSTESRPPGRWWNNGDGNVYDIIGLSNEKTANIDLSDAVAKFDCDTACSSSK